MGRRAGSVVGNAACVRFVRDESGSGICISPTGIVVTCAHCVLSPVAIFEFYGGQRAHAVLCKRDNKKDLALYQCSHHTCGDGFPWSPLATVGAEENSALTCVGTPSAFDILTNAPLCFYPAHFHVSQGHCLGYMILRRNKHQSALGLGRMRHTCWTYWGHSGSPLFNKRGEVCAIHNAHDRGMGYAIALDALAAFVAG